MSKSIGEESLRIRAEQMAAVEGSETAEPGTLAEARRLLHELRVRRCELELQNEQLLGRQSLLKSVINGTSDAVYVKDLQGRYLLFNTAAEKVVGKSEAEVLGKDDRSLFPLAEALAVMEGDRGVLESRTVKTYEETVTAADGRTSTFLSTKGPLFDNEGKTTGLFGIAHNITERKRAEEELSQSHDLLAQLAKLVPGVIYQYRLYPDGRSAFPYSSPGMNDIYEVSPEEVREDATPVFGRLHPDDHARVGEAIFESARQLSIFYCEFKVILPRQGLRWRWSQAHPVRLEDGSTLWHGIILDVTERKKAETERQELEMQLRQSHKMESVGRLAGGVAHDFNNMLQLILGHADMAIDLVSPEESLYDHLALVRKAAQRSADLTRQLLAFARKQVVAPKVLNLNDTVSGMLKMLQRLIGEDIHLSWKPASDTRPVKIDPSQIDQILANLCINARDAISGGGKMTIETANATFDDDYCSLHPDFVPGTYVGISVSDDGCGMDKETLSHIFEPFFTTKRMGEGTGLGLATVYGIVRQNNGFINVYSEPGKGTRFTIYLPRFEGGSPTAEIAGSASPNARGNETILVVEDDPDLLDLTRSMLEKQGYTVLSANSPADALRRAEGHSGKIHLLLSDVVMPQMNGRELSHKIVSLHPNARCLFMSGYTANVIAHHGVLDEGVHFIQKPFSTEDLATKVRGALERA